jgi:hypothetical protein
MRSRWPFRFVVISTLSGCFPSYPTILYGRIISLSSCSRTWQMPHIPKFLPRRHRRACRQKQEGAGYFSFTRKNNARATIMRMFYRKRQS